MELKAMTKIVKDNDVRTTGEKIVGVNEGFLPNYPDFN
jgi:hypothetical protein